MAPGRMSVLANLTKQGQALISEVCLPAGQIISNSNSSSNSEPPSRYTSLY
jgi:hypothetical protein